MRTIFLADPILGQNNKYYYFYKILNKINNKFYYGVHETFKINDFYKGSGKSINNAYKKYGIDNFEKYIIKFFEDKNKMYDYESKTVNIDLVNDSNCYNETVGGKIPPNRSGIKTLKLVNNELVGVSKGNIWIKKENKCIKINGEYLDKYIKDGWIRGRLFSNPNYNKKITKGKIVVNNGVNNKFINKDDINNYIDKGWSIGKITFKKLNNTVWVHLNNHQKQISKSELEEYLKNGWKKGMNSKSRRDCTYINNGIEIKNIKKSELEEYLKNGWKKGRYFFKIVHINKDGKNLMINESELDEYLKNGWKKGSNQKTTINTVLMSKDNKKKRVPISEVQIYMNDGWVPSKRYINNNLNK